MNSRYILDVLADAERDPSDHGPAPEEPAYIKGLFRGLKKCAPPETARREGISVAQARRRIKDALSEYLAGHSKTLLLIKALPGVGKTTVAVEAAEMLALEGRRVLYSGPRHDFYGDIMAMASRPSLWYEWLPRQKEDDDKGRVRTCGHADHINEWLRRGYRGMDFCKHVCGWDVVNNVCVYHAQKRRREPCIFGQHQHVTLGHPLRFDVVIGDESPLGAFAHEWTIPSKWVYVRGLDPTDPLAELLHILAELCESGARVEGENLLTLLGGPQRVLSACENFRMPVDASILAPKIHSASEADDVPWAHLHYLVPMLAREARAALSERPYPHRVLVGSDGLTLLLRRPINDQLPDHIVWLDATAEPRLYEACFGRDVQVIDAQPRILGRIFQVHDRANGKTTVLSKQGKTGKADQLEDQVAHIIETHGYRRPAIISYMKLIETTNTFRDLAHTHFYAARGTNALEDVDALIVAGVPQPPIPQLLRLAAMIFWEKMGAFQPAWVCKALPYNYVDPDDGQGREYQVPGFWGDPDLHSILWAMREAELIQAAHRCRPVNKPVDIWLLFNLPIEELPPTRLLSISDLFGAPEGVNAYDWPDVLEVAERMYADHQAVTAPDLVRELGITRATASKYIDKLSKMDGWKETRAATKKRGRPPKAATKA